MSHVVSFGKPNKTRKCRKVSINGHAKELARSLAAMTGWWHLLC
jgi:hypothetical protein